MKKFYIPVFTAVFLLTSFFSQAQVYNSINSNPLNLTLDDPAFWQGGVPPPNPCVGCTITVNTTVTIPHQGGSTFPPDNTGPFMNHVTLDGCLLKLQGSGTVLTLNTYLTLKNTTKVVVGTDPSFAVSMFDNDQVDLDATSSIRLGNINCEIDANNGVGNTIQGPYDDFAGPPPGNPRLAGIYSIFTGPPVGGFNYSYTLNGAGIGYANSSFAFYNFNCAGPGGCTFGVINGPAATGPDATFGVIFASSATLPVQLVQFLATKNDDGSVKVSWATSQEQNSSHFDVERSSDQAGWTALGTVKAKGYSSTTSNYTFTDKSPVDGTGYYRLKMVDLDAKFTYSKTVSVTADKNSVPLVIYNNPFTDQIRLKVNVSRLQNLVLTVSDMLGRTYINQSYQAQPGDNFVNLQPNAGGSGMYILRIQGDSYDQTVKLEKQ